MPGLFVSMRRLKRKFRASEGMKSLQAGSAKDEVPLSIRGYRNRGRFGVRCNESIGAATSRRQRRISTGGLIAVPACKTERGESGFQGKSAYGSRGELPTTRDLVAA